MWEENYFVEDSELVIDEKPSWFDIIFCRVDLCILCDARLSAKENAESLKRRPSSRSEPTTRLDDDGSGRHISADEASPGVSAREGGVDGRGREDPEEDSKQAVVEGEAPASAAGPQEQQQEQEQEQEQGPEEEQGRPSSSRSKSLSKSKKEAEAQRRKEREEEKKKRKEQKKREEQEKKRREREELEAKQKQEQEELAKKRSEEQAREEERKKRQEEAGKEQELQKQQEMEAEELRRKQQQQEKEEQEAEEKRLAEEAENQRKLRRAQEEQERQRRREAEAAAAAAGAASESDAASAAPSDDSTRVPHAIVDYKVAVRDKKAWPTLTLETGVSITKHYPDRSRGIAPRARMLYLNSSENPSLTTDAPGGSRKFKTIYVRGLTDVIRGIDENQNFSKSSRKLLDNQKVVTLKVQGYSLCMEFATATSTEQFLETMKYIRYCARKGINPADNIYMSLAT